MTKNDFEKNFHALKFPVPESKFPGQVDTEEKDVGSFAELFSLSKAPIEEYHKQLQKLETTIV